MLEAYTANLLIVIVFAVGYIAIIFEHPIRVNKTASALLMAVLTWMFFFLIQGDHHADHLGALGERLNDVSQIIFFLMGAMTLVELIDSHKGFKFVTDLIQTNSKKKLLWILGIATFFLSAVLDNLTTTIVMVSLLRKLVPDSKDRMLLGSIVVIAANAGGAWTPIGDVTTTMLWINGNITTLSIMKSLFIPSFISLLVALFIFGLNLKGRYPQAMQKAQAEKAEPGARLIFFLGIGSLIFVPIFKTLTGLPPYMGMLISLGFLWLVTDWIHSPYQERVTLRVPNVLTRIDTSGILFFLGILLCISSLDASGILESLAQYLGSYITSFPLLATLIGLVSAVIDNVPLVAATMGMYDVATHPVDSILWEMIAYCAGTGGSILIIGSAAGVALMGMEKIDFRWYARKISFIAFLSYLSGIGVYLLQNILF